MHTDSKKHKTPTDANNVLADGLSLDQARYEAIVNGKKIRHKYFLDTEYIYAKGVVFFTEDNYVLPKSYFLNMDENWQNGWSVVS